MAVGLWISFDGGTREQYDAVNAEMGEAFDRFQQERLGPAVEALGDKARPGPPSIKEFPVYNTISG